MPPVPKSSRPAALILRPLFARVGVGVPLVRVIVGLRAVWVRLPMGLHVDALFGRMPFDGVAAALTPAFG